MITSSFVDWNYSSLGVVKMRSRITAALAGTIVTVCMGWLGGSIALAETTNTASPTSTVVDARTALKNVRTAASKIKRTSMEVMNDVTQRKLNDDEGDPIFFEPSNQQVEKDPTLFSKENSTLGNVEAPRKSWLDADLNHLDHWVTLLNEDLDAIPASGQTSIGEPYKQMRDIAQDINNHMRELSILTKGPRYDNLAIAKAAMAVYTGIQKMESPWKSAIKSAGK
jgi:hypothetical protein